LPPEVIREIRSAILQIWDKRIIHLLYYLRLKISPPQWF
jgi:hypothetical protein